MSTTLGPVSGLKAWRLVHEEKRPAKQAAALLGIPISDLYELLASERRTRDVATHRAAALGLLPARN